MGQGNERSGSKNDRARRCPVCGKPTLETLAPFCSKRCADVDLHRWLGGVYAIPDNNPPEPADEDDV